MCVFEAIHIMYGAESSLCGTRWDVATLQEINALKC